MNLEEFTKFLWLRELNFAFRFIDDYKFESVWNHPNSALEKFKRCGGVITPDFSTYQDMPAALKIYNAYNYCFLGIPQNSIVCVSTVGCLESEKDEKRFTEGLKVMVETLNPSHILMYGKKGRNFFDKYIESGIPVTFYDPSHIIPEKKDSD